MTDQLCSSCHRPKATLTCGPCQRSLCKNCAQFLAEDTFSYLSLLPEELKHSYYCSPCYETHVEPALQSYNETMEQARNLNFFFATQKRPVRPIRRAVRKVTVAECHDRDETILRLAFKAVEQ